jgi:type II secretory pathway pseudopilin PulG
VIEQPGIRGRAGFTIVEMMIATAVLMAVMGAILTVTRAAQATFQAQGEVADMHQRLRAAVDRLAADLRAAAAVRPYRVGGTRDDAAAGIYYRPDTISVLGVPSSALSPDADATRTYYLKSDVRSNTFELMQYDGRQTDLPVVEHVVSLAFDYFGAQPPGSALTALDPAILTDGPWAEDALHRRFDVDLLRVRQVRVYVRVESADPSLRGLAGALFVHAGTSNAPERFVPDQEIELRVAPRNMKLEP